MLILKATKQKTMSRKQLYKSKVWERVRLNVWLKQGCLCNRCHRAVYVDGLTDYIPKEKRLRSIVHHIEHLNDYNYTDDSIALDENNLEGLCIDCHNKEHYKNKCIRDDLMFDEYGNIIPR